MRYGNSTFFAPDVPFTEVDLGGERLPEQFHKRIDGYYLAAARSCLSSGLAFGAGVLQMAAIDALSIFAHGPNRQYRIVWKDFQAFARTRLPSFRDRQHARLLYDNFRNGLVHEARLKEGCQFAFGTSSTLDLSGAYPVVNPALLQSELERAAEMLVQEIRESAPFREQLVMYIQREFAKDLRSG
jgi:hypothetical protein